MTMHHARNLETFNINSNSTKGITIDHESDMGYYCINQEYWTTPMNIYGDIMRLTLYRIFNEIFVIPTLMCYFRLGYIKPNTSGDQILQVMIQSSEGF